jgi:hypothetical protein
MNEPKQITVVFERQHDNAFRATSSVSSAGAIVLAGEALADFTAQRLVDWMRAAIHDEIHIGGYRAPLGGCRTVKITVTMEEV